MVHRDFNMPPGVILAGGRGRRMGGQDKAQTILAGRPLVSHVIQRLRPQVSHLAINANGDPHRFGRKYPVLADGFDDHPGPLAGVLAAMEWGLALGSDWVVTVATDTPFLPEDLVARLVRAQVAARAPIVMVETPDGLQPVTALWYTELAESLRGSLASGTHKVTDFAEAKDAVTVMCSEAAFFNVNTPEDLQLAETRLAGA